MLARPLLGKDKLKGAETETVCNPYTGETIGKVKLVDPSEVNSILSRMGEIAQKVAALSTGERAELLWRMKEGVARSAKKLVRTIVEEAGKPICFAEGEVARCQQTFAAAYRELSRSQGELFPVDFEARSRGYIGGFRYVPRGPVFALSPFNFPLNLGAHKWAPALAAGNPVVYKPPPQAPFSTALLYKIFLQASPLPEAVVYLPCSVLTAEAIVRADACRVLSFTGSAKVGWMLKSIAGQKKVILELGGNAGVIVDKGTDIKKVAAKIALAANAYAGQVCIKVQRVYVEKTIFRSFCAALKEAIKALPCGDPREKETVVGPLISAEAADRVEEWCREALRAGARCLLKGKRRQNLVTPYLFTDVPKSVNLFKEEVFGPATIVEPFSHFESALREVNQSRYGLQAGIFTQNLSRAHLFLKEMKVGGVIINDVPTFRVDVMPYGGTKDSGFGREGFAEAIREMQELQTVIVAP